MSCCSLPFNFCVCDVYLICLCARVNVQVPECMCAGEETNLSLLGEWGSLQQQRAWRGTHGVGVNLTFLSKRT